MTSRAIAFIRVYQPIILVFRLLGLWPNNGNRSIIYTVYGAFVLILFSFILTTFELIQLVKYTQKEKITESLFMCLTDVAVFIKCMNFYWRWRSMQGLHQMAMAFHIETDTDTEAKLDRNTYCYLFQ